MDCVGHERIGLCKPLPISHSLLTNHPEIYSKHHRVIQTGKSQWDSDLNLDYVRQVDWSGGQTLAERVE